MWKDKTCHGIFLKIRQPIRERLILQKPNKEHRMWTNRKKPLRCGRLILKITLINVERETHEPEQRRSLFRTMCKSKVKCGL